MSSLRVALLLVALPALARAETPAQAPAQVTRTELRFPSGSETIGGVLARSVEKKPPKDAPKRPGVVLVHEWWGLNDFIKKKADDLAARGYVVLVPDLYRGQVASDADTAHQLSRGLPRDRAQRDLTAAIDALVAQPDVDRQRLAVVGWCMGGGLAAELLTNETRLKAGVLYYGSLPTDSMALSRIQAAVLGNYGADDRGIPVAAVRAFEQQLKKQGNPVDMKVYAGAGHAFASSSDKTVFRPEAAADADARTLAFLAKWLKP